MLYDWGSRIGKGSGLLVAITKGLVMTIWML
jgi:hypothetical protein